MATLVWLKNDSARQAFSFRIMKHFEVTLYPGEVKTIPVNDMAMDWERLIPKTPITERGRDEPFLPIRYGWYDTMRTTHEELLAMIDGESPFPDSDDSHTEPSPRQYLEKLEVVTYEQLQECDELELRFLANKLGLNPSNMKGRPGLTNDILEEMDKWKQLPIESRAVIDDESVTFKLIQEGWIEAPESNEGTGEEDSEDNDQSKE